MPGCGDLPYCSTGEGMHRYVDPLDGQTYVGAYLRVDNAQRVLACFDQPDLKAPFTAAVTAPAGWTVVGNGARQSVTDARWTFAPTPPLSTYLFSWWPDRCTGSRWSTVGRRSGCTAGDRWPAPGPGGRGVAGRDDGVLRPLRGALRRALPLRLLRLGVRARAQLGRNGVISAVRCGYAPRSRDG